jgi:hypothetical protein
MPRVGKRGPRGYKARAATLAARERAIREGRRPAAKGQAADGPVGHGGARPGAGKPAGPPWKAIRDRVSSTGATLEELLALPQIARWLDDETVMEQLRAEVDQAQRIFRLNVRAALAKKGLKSFSVSALLGIARNTSGLDFDSQTIPQSGAPDVAGLANKIDELLEKLAKNAQDAEAKAKERAAAAVPRNDVE